MTVDLVTILMGPSETIRASFIALDASNKRCNVQKFIFLTLVIGIDG